MPNVCEAFQDAGVSAVIVHGELSESERKTRLAEYESGTAQVVVNVAVLTEGYDFTPTSCVVLLRPSSHKSTLTQMIGRGLRTIDPIGASGRHQDRLRGPGLRHRDLDARISLEQDVNLDGHQHHGEAPTKDCPSCGPPSRSAAANARCAASSGRTRPPRKEMRWPIS